MEMRCEVCGNIVAADEEYAALRQELAEAHEIAALRRERDVLREGLGSFVEMAGSQEHLARHAREILNDADKAREG